MLSFSRWKAFFILAVCICGVALSIPSFIHPGSLPAWVPQPRVNLGLDLQGGSSLLLEIDAKSLERERLTALREEIIRKLRGTTHRPREVLLKDNKITLAFNEAGDVATARQTLKDVLGIMTEGRITTQVYDQKVDGNNLIVSLSPQGLAEMTSQALDQSTSIVRRRLDESGISEPMVARQGQTRILVELPGVSDPGRIKKLLGSTAKLTFRLVAPEGTPAGPDVEILPYADATEHGSATLPVRRHVEVDGLHLVRASAGHSTTSGWVVNFGLDTVAAKQFANVSTNHVGQPFAIVLDGKVISAPTIREPILGGQGQISGNFTVEQANDLSVLLRAGALPAELRIVEERTVGASLGADAIRSGLYSIASGLVMVAIFVMALYGRFGVFACAALIANLGLTITCLSLLGATLTLPGIAGILLALGMAVDANILVNERIREEAARLKGVVSPIEAGFRRAFATIVDANATTLIKMLILFFIGIGAIKGFAITISLGIVISMFTSLVLVRLLISFWLKQARPKTLAAVGTRLRHWLEMPTFRFMRARIWGLVFSALISAASLVLAFHPGLKMGVDFSGGVAIETRLPDGSEPATLRSTLSNLGLGPVHIQQYGGPHDILIRFERPPNGDAGVQEAVGRTRAAIEKVAPGAEIRRVESVGPSLGTDMLHSGLVALAVASVAMFCYIAFRFEWPFAVGAVLTMLLDITKTVGFLALTGFEFNLAAIAAILTIMGFSINDKVVVYDRIRENLSKYRNMPLRELVDRSINETLARTVGTSLALLLAITPLAIFGGPALSEFALTLLFGLVLATSSSIFIAAPILLHLGEHRLRRGSVVKVSAVPPPKSGRASAKAG
jgi:SecD/SecF fusion protein